MAELTGAKLRHAAPQILPARAGPSRSSSRRDETAKVTRRSETAAFGGLVALGLCLCLHPALADTQSAAVDSAGDPTADPIVIGLDADMSKGAAQSGEAIRRGLVLAIEQINGRGGVLDQAPDTPEPAAEPRAGRAGS